MYGRAHSGYIFCVIFKRLFCVNSLRKQKNRLNDTTFAFYIEISADLEALKSNFQPSRQLKIFKNSGSEPVLTIKNEIPVI